MTQGVGLGGACGGAAKALYEKMHKELAKSGVDGVKVDSQAAVVTLGGGRGGSVDFTRAYIAALEESVASRYSSNLEENLICEEQLYLIFPIEMGSCLTWYAVCFPPSGLEMQAIV